MPLDKVIVNHLDEQEILEKSIEEDVESMISNINISDIMNGAEDVLLGMVEVIQKRLTDEYYKQASENGIMLAQEIVKDGDIKVPESNDPNLNEDIVDGNKGER